MINATKYKEPDEDSNGGDSFKVKLESPSQGWKFKGKLSDFQDWLNTSGFNSINK